MKWTVIVTRDARRDLESVPMHVAVRARKAIDLLAANPRPHGARKLRGRPDAAWRIRVGDWRMVYAIDEQLRTVYVHSIDHRGSVYR